MYDRSTETFVKVAQLGSFAKAAKALYLSGVSVKKQMDALESRVGARLFERTNQGVSLTDAGGVLYEAAVRVIELSDDAFARARQAAESGKRAIRVGTSFLRPCGDVVDRWTRLGGAELPFRIEIVPFSDDAEGLAAMIDGLGRGIDLFCGPCDSRSWQERCTVRLLGTRRVQVGVPRSDALARKRSLAWADLEGRELLLPGAGESEVLDALRAEVASDHPDVHVREWRGFYDASAFNECAARGCLMETLDMWSGVHPSVATLPMEWGYAVPFGIVCAAEPSEAVREFVELIAAT